MTISGGRTEQLDIFCRVTGFMSDFLSSIDVELIQFFHRAIQLVVLMNFEYETAISADVLMCTVQAGAAVLSGTTRSDARSAPVPA